MDQLAEEGQVMLEALQHMGWRHGESVTVPGHFPFPGHSPHSKEPVHYNELDTLQDQKQTTNSEKTNNKNKN